jgi:FkbM family methyltransferase
MIIGRSRKLRRSLSETAGWLLLREQRIVQLEQEIGRIEELIRQREEIIHAREEVVRSLEQQIEQLKNLKSENTLRVEIERREATVREREARIFTLEMEIEAQNTELRLFQSALNEAQDVLRERDAGVVLLERQTNQVFSAAPDHSSTGPSGEGRGGTAAMFPPRAERIVQLEQEIERTQQIIRQREELIKAREEIVRSLEQHIEEGEETLRVQIERRAATVREKEQRIAQLEQETERTQQMIYQREATIRENERNVRSLEQRVEELENPAVESTRRIEMERQEAIVREREARILALEVEVEGRDSELHLLRSALKQAHDVLRKRDAKLVFLERQPRQLQDEPSEVPDPGSARPSGEGEGSPAAVLQKWRLAAVHFANESLNGAQELIEPYILEKSMQGSPTRLLVATRESQVWYDRFQRTEGPLIDALQMVRIGDTVFDCGAHHGVHSVLYSRRVGQGGRVVAFEPFPMNLEIAKLNALLNNCSNIDFIDAGLSNMPGRVNASVSEQCIVLKDQDVGDVVPLKLAALDEYSELQPDFIKMDVEGSEIDALEGARQILATKPCLYIEMHPGLLPRFGKTMMQVFQFIDLAEYHCFINYPGKEELLKYRLEFELILPCALFFVPRDRPPLLRYYTT